MKITKELIEKVGRLSKLRLSEHEKEKYCEEFKDILQAFTVLDEVSVKGVRSSFKPVEEKNVLREDKASESISQEEALKFTKHEEKGFFIGPKTVE